MARRWQAVLAEDAGLVLGLNHSEQDWSTRVTEARLLIGAGADMAVLLPWIREGQARRAIRPIEAAFKIFRIWRGQHQQPRVLQWPLVTGPMFDERRTGHEQASRPIARLAARTRRTC